jgi:uncharacterized membrane protein
MAHPEGETQAGIAFRAILTPSRSLGPRGFLILMAALTAASFALGLAFWRIGAWPVGAFLGLDVLALYVAFRLNYRDGRAYETVELTAAELAVTSVDRRGASRRYVFNPYWVRLELREAPDGRTSLVLSSHGRGLRFAGCLSDEERRDLAGALGQALGSLRGGRGA